LPSPILLPRSESVHYQIVPNYKYFTLIPVRTAYRAFSYLSATSPILFIGAAVVDAYKHGFE
jgi:hypothetical protein